MPVKQMLILRVTSDACDVEIAQIKSAAEMHGIIVDVTDEITSTPQLADAVRRGVPYDYIYVASHGSADGLSGDNYSVSWYEFAYHVCVEETINDNCIFLLACCRGGFQRVAYDIFAGCSLIEYVFGPRWTLTKPDLTAAFHIFIYNMEQRKLQPGQAAKRASDGTGYDFLCYDRVEIEQTEECLYRRDEVEVLLQPLYDDGASDDKIEDEPVAEQSTT